MKNINNPGQRLRSWGSFRNTCAQLSTTVYSSQFVECANKQERSTMMGLPQNFASATAALSIAALSWLPFQAAANPAESIYNPDFPGIEADAAPPSLIKDAKGVYRQKQGSTEYYADAGLLAKKMSKDKESITVFVVHDANREAKAVAFASGAANWLAGHPKVDHAVPVVARTRPASLDPNGELYMVYLNGFIYSHPKHAPDGRMDSQTFNRLIKDIVIGYVATEAIKQEDQQTLAGSEFASLDAK